MKVSSLGKTMSRVQRMIRAKYSEKKEGYTVNNIKMSLFPAYKSFLFCNFAI